PSRRGRTGRRPRSRRRGRSPRGRSRPCGSRPSAARSSGLLGGAVCQDRRMRFQATTFRPLFGRILSVVIGVLGLAAIVSTVAGGDLASSLRVVGPVALVVLLTFAAFWFP